MRPTSRGRLLLVLILAGAAVLRFWGLRQGLPNPSARPDERELLVHTAQFAAGDWNPHWFVYPNLYFYVVFAWEQACLALRRLWQPTPAYAEMLRVAVPTLIFYGRLLSATVGTLTVALCYAVGRRLGGTALGLVAALVLATNYLHVRDSHMLKNEILLPAGVLVSVWALARWVERPGVGRAVGAGVAIGVATALMYTGILLLAPAWVAGGLVAGRRRWRWLVPHPHVLVLAAAAALTLAVTCPYLFLDPGGARKTLGIHSFVIYGTAPDERAAAGAGWAETLASFVRHRAFGYHLTVSLRYGCGLAVALATALALWRAWRPPQKPFLALAAAFCIVYYVVIAFSRVHFARFVTPLTPLLALLAAELVLGPAGRLSRARQRGPVLVALVLLLVAEPLASSVAYDRIAARTDTRVLARQWMEENLPRTAVVAEIGSKIFPLGEVELPPGMRGVIPPPGDTDLARAGVTHVIIRSHQLVFSQPDAAQVQALESQLRLLAEFSPYRDAPAGYFEPEDQYYIPFTHFCGVLRPGPYVRVYAYSGSP